MSATLSTGLSWSTGEPRLHLHGDSYLDLRPGSPVAVRGNGPRHCVGYWSSADGDHDCPFDGTVAATTTDAQCPDCARADSGRRLARGFITAGDDRPYRLYLAWFGTGGKIKVGITAQARGTARLLDQGARFHSFIAEGPLPAIRAAEQAVSGAGLATERVRSAGKTDGWWADAGDAATALRDTAAAIAKLDLPERVNLLEPAPVDNSALFGLDRTPPPDGFRPLTAFGETSVLSGRVLVAAGKLLLVSTPGTAVLCDTRLLAGWPLADAGAQPSRLSLAEPVRPKRPQDEAPTLF